MFTASGKEEVLASAPGRYRAASNKSCQQSTFWEISGRAEEAEGDILVWGMQDGGELDPDPMPCIGQQSKIAVTDTTSPIAGSGAFLRGGSPLPKLYERPGEGRYVDF